ESDRKRETALRQWRHACALYRHRLASFSDWLSPQRIRDRLRRVGVTHEAAEHYVESRCGGVAREWREGWNDGMRLCTGNDSWACVEAGGDYEIVTRAAHVAHAEPFRSEQQPDVIGEANRFVEKTPPLLEMTAKIDA